MLILFDLYYFNEMTSPVLIVVIRVFLGMDFVRYLSLVLIDVLLDADWKLYQ